LQDTSDADGSLHNSEFNHLYIIKKVWKIRYENYSALLWL
jgi:hypothetical protein